MHIVVCAKYVPDPEAAFSMFKIDEAAKRVVPAAGLPFVTSPFDEQAIEAALRIRDAGVDAGLDDEAERDPDCDRRRAHVTRSRMPTTAISSAKPYVSVLVRTRCCREVPASAPTAAGKPTSAP